MNSNHLKDEDIVRSREWNDRQREVDPGFRAHQPPPGHEPPDDQIKADVRAALKTIGLELIDGAVQVLHGTVVLWGKVRTKDDSEAALDAAWHATGVVDVIDELEILNETTH